MGQLIIANKRRDFELTDVPPGLEGEVIKTKLSNGELEADWGTLTSTEVSHGDKPVSDILTDNTSEIAATNALLTPTAAGQALIATERDGKPEALFQAIQADAVKYGNNALVDVGNVGAALDAHQDILEPFTFSGAGPHNSIYRGKFLGNAVTAAQYAAISGGTFDDLYIGDYWTISGVNYRIAAFDYYYRCGDTDLTTHHAVIVPDSYLYSATMNATNITTGGYVGSVMYTTNLATAKTTINAAFSGHVMQHRQYLTNAVSSGRASAGAWFDSTVEIMNEIMVYGNGVFSPVSDGTTVPANYTVCKSQLPLFALRPDLISNRVTYWLRDVVSGTYFAIVGDYGFAGYTNASSSCGVRPAFSIS